MSICCEIEEDNEVRALSRVALLKSEEGRIKYILFNFLNCLEF